MQGDKTRKALDGQLNAESAARVFIPPAKEEG